MLKATTYHTCCNIKYFILWQLSFTTAYYYSLSLRHKSPFMEACRRSFCCMVVKIYNKSHCLLCVGMWKSSRALLLLSSCLFHSLMSGVKNNVGRGINIALVNGNIVNLEFQILKSNNLLNTWLSIIVKYCSVVVNRTP